MEYDPDILFQFRTQVCLTLKCGPEMNYVMRSSQAENIIWYVDHTDLIKIKKVKLTLEQSTKARMGSRAIALLFLWPRRGDGGGWSTPCPGRFALEIENR